MAMQWMTSAACWENSSNNLLLKSGHIELLAPARDAAAGRAAIGCGADALYIGAPRFGAREQAGNSLTDLEVLITFAHRYWARLYITLNTLLRDDELEEAVALVRRLHDMGADGLIIQDLGLLECGLPPIPLIASTQMHNHTPERVAFLAAAGFQRVILARELGIGQIRAIRANSSLELECFIHGALCVSYSGQCYLSLARGGRSGNRGQCAQPCRLPYRLVDGHGVQIGERQHLLSLRDLNLTGHLGELIDAGITSFKIEGRLKDESYVKNIVTWYRRELDALLEGRGLRPASSGRVNAAFTPDPAKSFNRRFTTYFLHGRDRTMTAMATPKSIGEPIGTVRSCKDGVLELEAAGPAAAAGSGTGPAAGGRRSGAREATRSDTRHDHLAGARGRAGTGAPAGSPDRRPALANGDGLAWFDSRGELQGVRVNRASGLRAELDRPVPLSAGTVIYRNYSQAWQEQLKKTEGSRQIGVDFELGEWEEGFWLRARDEDGVTVEVRCDAARETARQADQAAETVRSQLHKTGGTPFHCREVAFAWPEPRFLPLALVNRLRREALEALLAARLQAHPLVRVAVAPTSHPFPQPRLGFAGNVLNRRARAFYERHGVTEIAPAAESGMDLSGERVMTMKYCLRGELGLCGERLNAGGYAEPLALIDDSGGRLRLDFRCDECEMDVFLEE